jgi:hypothetical protein
MYTLKSDHGKFASAEDGGGLPGQVIDGRPGGLMTATRDSAGAWEQFMIFESDDEPGIYSIQSCHGFYACCENEGKDGIIVFNRTEVGAWEKFTVSLQDNGSKASFQSVCRPGYFIKVWGDGRVELAQPMWEGQPSLDPGGYETFTVDPPISSFAPVESLIKGQLRITDAGFADDTGPILPIGLHVGDLFSVFVRDPDKAEGIVATAQAAGYPYIHFWMNLGTLGDYWSGRECGPGYTNDFWGQLGRLGDLLDKYGLKGGYNLGDYKLWSGTHCEFFAELGRHLRGRQNQTAAYVFGGNEAWQTGADSKEEISDALECFTAECNTVPVTTTAPTSESAEDIAEWCGGDFFAIHGFRDNEDHDRIRHIFSVQWEGHPPSKYGIQDEPTGPGDEVSVKPAHCYEGRDVDANHMCALAVQSLMCNQGFNYFCGAGVKSDTLLTSYAGFHEVPVAKNIVPLDIMGWPGVFHFGSSQSGQRVFSPLAEDTLRFDHRISHEGKIFGIFYGDQGHTRAKCERACFLTLVSWDGSMSPEQQFDLSEEISFDFVRSTGGQPNGYTAQVVIGRLR